MNWGVKIGSTVSHAINKTGTRTLCGLVVGKRWKELPVPLRCDECTKAKRRQTRARKRAGISVDDAREVAAIKEQVKEQSAKDAGGNDERDNWNPAS